MLSWLAGSNQGVAGDESMILDAPETPAPVFAYRAFKNAMLGTPAPEVDEDKDLTIPIRPLNPSSHKKNDDLKKAVQKFSLGEDRKMEIPKLEPKVQEPAHAIASPSKSILLTPGTATTRRKTVSFGAGVKDNERKPIFLDDERDLELSGGNISSQWSMSVSSGSGRRSKLTQSLLEAREEKFGQKVDGFDDCTPVKKDERKDTREKAIEDDCRESDQSEEDEEDEGDVTVNLEAPHSQSGKYWKSEFENYRTKTEKEIRKLIEYRSVAKSYAKKKETEALRLTEKLKQEELKVAEMEKRVSELAAGMVGGGDGENSNKDQMFRELSRQTAAALQYKQKTATFRKTLEDHGIVDKEMLARDISADESAAKLREVEEALWEANARLRESEGNPKLKELQELVRSSERKAAELKRENLLLQRNLDRVKTELLHVGERRKAQEERAKKREERLESRAQDYSKRLTDSLRDHQAAEEALRKSFDAERKQMQETIDLLKGTLALRSDNSQPQACSRSTRREEITEDILERLRKTTRSYHARADSYDSGDDQLEITLPSDRDVLNSPKKSPAKSREDAQSKAPESPFDEETIGALLKTLRGTGSPTKQSIQQGTLEHIREDTEATNSAPMANVRRKLQLKSDTKISGNNSKNSDEPLNLAEELFIRLGGSARNLESLRQKDGDMTNTTFGSAPTLTGDVKSTPLSKPAAKQRTSYRPGHSPRPSLSYLNSGRVDTLPKRPKSRAASQTERQRATNHSSDINRQSITKPDGPAQSKLGSIPSDRLAAAKARLRQRQLNAKVEAEDKENMLSA
ncbi:hypothetical protein MGYG_03736 [Nannizzia gypsea CBS 118893]|uniref:Spindle pole body-associated protein cut12 domain-containing protein n=1 Tax=Arthroderma gypseum (strain ATCC MYA-4604 / CBS 118893) TaxID=535722 RepID=E4UTM2_ARTGP|nr:hypothetical protein MGYG_03736 [Nannizzia gypsea CBS 118893]EFR00731.1 hypothetical protein MGYG_03736 [Nannizzia gypsea CBS 118893]